MTGFNSKAQMCLITAVILLLVIEPADATPAWRSGTPYPVSVSRFAYGNGQYVAVDPQGLNSKDGRHWWLRERPSLLVRDFMFAKGLFIAIGDTYRPNLEDQPVATVAISTNGNDWRHITLPFTPMEGAGIYYGQGTFVARLSPVFTPDDIFMVSTNGIDWTATNAFPWLGRQLFVDNRVISYSSQGVFLSKNDGEFELQTTRAFGSIAYGNNVFAGISDGTTYLSADLVDWTALGTAPAGLQVSAFFKGAFYARHEGKVHRFDGTSQWEEFMEFEGPLHTLRALGSKLFAAYQKTNSTEFAFQTSDDAVTWQNPILPGPEISVTTANLRTVAFGRSTSGSEMFVAGGDQGTIVRSTNGFDWTISDSGVSSDISQIVYGKGMFVGNTGSGELLLSTDGVEWTRQSSPANGSMAYGNGLFMLMAGKTFVSSDAVRWTTNNNFLDLWAQVLGFANHKFYAVERDGPLNVIFASVDGVEWKEEGRVSVDELRLTKAAGGDGEFLAIGTAYRDTGRIDRGWYGITATLSTLGPWTAEMSDIQWRDGMLWIAYERGPFMWGRPGAWSFGVPSGPIAGYNAIVHGAGKFVAVGPRGTIVTASDQPSFDWRDEGMGVGLHFWGMFGKRYVVQSSERLGPDAIWRDEKEITVRALPEIILSEPPTNAAPTFFRVVLK